MSNDRNFIYFYFLGGRCYFLLLRETLRLVDFFFITVKR